MPPSECDFGEFEKYFAAPKKNMVTSKTHTEGKAGYDVVARAHEEALAATLQ